MTLLEFTNKYPELITDAKVKTTGELLSVYADSVDNNSDLIAKWVADNKADLKVVVDPVIAAAKIPQLLSQGGRFSDIVTDWETVNKDQK